MKYLVIATVILSGCATQHRPSTANIQNLYVDCTNREIFEAYYEKNLKLTNVNKVDVDPTEKLYYATLKDKLWTLRSTCR
jgi:hypothetical protein